jgi:hypothetical protein
MVTDAAERRDYESCRSADGERDNTTHGRDGLSSTIPVAIHAGQRRPEGATAVRCTLHWGRDNARRISTVAELEGLLSFLTTIRGRDGAPYGVDLLPAGAAGGGLQLGIGHAHRAFAVWLDAGGATDPGTGAGSYGIDDDLEAWPEPIGFDCGVEVVDFKPAWTRVTPRLTVQAAREYVLTGAMPTCLRFDSNA